MAFKSSLDYISNVHNDIYPATDPTKSDLSQPGKTVLITGAGRGIGRSIALRYAEAGVSSIVLCARTVSELDEVEQSILAINSKITVAKHQLDVSSATNVAKVASKVPAVDILVNNAGHGGPWILMGDSDPDAWWKTYEINIKGPYLMTRYFISKLPKGGQIINVSSIGADVVFPMASCYQTSKLALTRLSEFTQVEYPDIICLSLHPGGVLTQLSSEVEAIRPYLNDTPELAAGFIVWLTKEFRQWLGGRFLYANWDVNELEARKDDITSKNLLKVKIEY